MVPAVQIQTAQAGADWFNEKYAQDLKVERFQFKFPNYLLLEDVFVPDHLGDTLIYFKEIELQVKSYSSLSKSLSLNEFSAIDARFYLRTHLGEERSNISQFIAAFQDDQPKDPNRSFNIEIDELAIDGGRFYLDNRNDTGKVHFYWQDVVTEVNDFLVAGKDVSGNIEHLEFNDGDEFEVHDSQANFLYGPKGIVVQDIELLTGRGHLKGELTLISSSTSSFAKFVDSIEMIGTIDYGAIAADDIRYFSKAYPYFPTARISGSFEGTVNHLKLVDFDLKALNSIRAKGDLLLKETTKGADLQLETASFLLGANSRDAETVIKLFRDSLPSLFYQIDSLQWQGSFYGGLFDFRTESRIRSNLADLDLDVTLSNLRDPELLHYEGRIDAERINVRLLSGGISDLKEAKLDLILNGEGIDPTTMSSTIEGEIQEVYYRDYTYKNLRVDGAINEGLFKGNFKSMDPNLRLDFNGIASFSADTSQYDFTAQIDSANLYPLQFSNDPTAQFQGNVKMDFLALDYDRWEGQIDLKNTSYRNRKKHYPFDDIKVISSGLDSIKNLAIRSEMLDADIKGNYTLKGINEVISSRIRKYRYPKSISQFNEVQEDFIYRVIFKNTGNLSQSLLPQFLVEPGSSLRGEYRATDQLLELNLDSKGIRYEEQILTDLKLRWLSGYADLLNFDIGSYSRGELARKIDSISLVNVFAGDSMNYQLDLILRGKEDSYGNFEGLIAIVDSNAYRMNIDQGQFNLGARDFQIDTQSVMRLDSSGLSIDWLEIVGPSLRLNAAGYISKDPYQILRMNIEGLDLDLINYFTSKNKAQFEGYLKGDIVANEILSTPRFLASISLDSLVLNDVDLGQMDIYSDYEHETGRINLDALMRLGRLEMLDVSGFYDYAKDGNLDLQFDFNRFRLAALEPFAAPIAENLRGLASGQLSIKGSAHNPDIKGAFALPKAGMTVSFLQTDYNLVGTPQLLLDNESIRFPNLELMDQYNTISYLNGEVRHKAFQDFYIDLQIDAQNLLVLNTTADYEDAYYGTAFASGSIKVQGPPSAVRVNANVASERNTEFFIPIGGATEVKQSGYVNFVSPETNKDSLQILGAQFALDEGVSLDFDMDINPNALVSIILNESTGNQLDGKGDGIINMKLEPNRDLELYGTYTVQEGIYRFNIEGLFAKNFLVEEGGTVVWNGDPYAARLDLTAVYKTKANPSILTGETAGTATDVNIYLYILGELTNPSINFDIEMPRATSSTQAVVANRLNTDQATNQQVFSLLAFNSFTPPSDFIDGTRNAINEWDLIAGQAAAFLNRFTGDYELSLSYQPANQGADPASTGNSQEELEVGLSKDFLDDRLTVNSSVEVPLNENNNSIAGDFELIYKLTQDGRVRAKAFNRSVDNNFNFSIGQQQLYQQGLGLSFKVDFESYREVFRKLEASKAKREEEQTAIQP